METQRMQKGIIGGKEKVTPRDLPEKIVSCAREVHFALGPGLLETTYEEALAHEFSLKGIRYLRQKEAKLSYKGKDIGWHRIDFLVEDAVVVELKSVEKLHGIHEAQLVSCLRSLRKKAGLLINFNAARFTDAVKRFAI